MFAKSFTKTAVAILAMAVVVLAQSENLEVEQRVLEAERRALEAERRALEAERRAFELESSANESSSSSQPFQSFQRQSETSHMTQKSVNHSGSVGIQTSWNMVESDALNFDLSGISTSIGANIFFPVDAVGMFNLGLGIAIGYVSVESGSFWMSDNLGWSYNAKYGLTSTSLQLSPATRVALNKHIYFDASLAINFPLSTKETLEITGYPKESFSLDRDVLLGLSVSARYDYFGVGFYLPFDGDAANGLGLDLYFPIEEIGIEIVPYFGYWFDSGYNEIAIGVGLRYAF